MFFENSEKCYLPKSFNARESRKISDQNSSTSSLQIFVNQLGPACLPVAIIYTRVFYSSTVENNVCVRTKFTVFQVLVGACTEDTVECVEVELEASEVRK